MEPELVRILEKHGVKRVVHLRLPLTFDVVKVLGIIATGSKKVIVVAPQDYDDVVERIKEVMTEKTVYVFRSTELEDEIIVAF